MIHLNKSRIAFVLTLCCVSTFWLIMILSVIKLSLPYNSLSGLLYGNSEMLFRSALPEGFAFFTRNPREFHITIYSADKKEIDLHNGSWKYLLGAKRFPRAYNVELGHIFTLIAGNEWYNCKEGTVECLDDLMLPTYTIKNNFPEPIMIGEFYLKINEPTPWAWAKSFNETSKAMPCKVMKLSIQ